MKNMKAFIISRPIRIFRDLGVFVSCAFAGLSLATAQESAREQVASAADIGTPLVWSGPLEPSEYEASALLQTFQRLRSAGVHAGVEAFESFINTHPKSGWTPSLRLKLAEYYRMEGRLSRTLDHCALAWPDVVNQEEPPVRELADKVLLLWSGSLADLGRVQDLDALLDSVGSVREFHNVHNQRRMDGVRQQLDDMKSRLAGLRYFKCGLYSVAQVAKLRSFEGDFCEVLNIAASPEGFSLAQLVNHARRMHLELRPVLRLSGNGLLAPSIVHMKLGHYAAILSQVDGGFRVADPLTRGERFMTGEAINEEASGYFLVEVQQSTPAEWAEVGSVEAARIFGKGANSYPAPPPPPPCASLPGTCPQSCALGGASFGAPPFGTPPSGCSAGICKGGDAGMPRWFVSEPYISLWLLDEPMSYRPSRGPEISLKLAYHQRETRPYSSSAFSLGPEWNMNFMSHILCRSSDFTVYAPAGGELRFPNPPSNPEYWTGARLTTSPAYHVSYPDGSWVEYTLLVAGGIGETNAYMTRIAQATGDSMTFYYSTNNNLVLLTHIVDVDGKTNYLGYDGTFASHIASVTNAPGHVVTFKYDENGYLTNVVDVVGLSSSFTYEDTGNEKYIDSLTTPYGETTFDHVNPGQCLCNGGKRAIHVEEPNGAKHLYLYVDDCTSFLPYSYTDVPTGVPVNPPYGDHSPALCNHNMYYRNSFYWGPNHYGLLSTNDIHYFTSNDFEVSRMRNWLHTKGELSLSGTINMERGLSPDADSEGAKVWYGYSGKAQTSWNYEGTNSAPSWIAERLPDGMTRYVYKEYNSLGNPTLSVTTNILGATYQGVTNWYVYSTDEINLLAITNQAGVRTHVYQYDSARLVTYETDALGDVTRYYYEDDQPYRIEREDLLTTTLDYAGGRLAKTVDLEINRTNTYAWANGYLHTHTDERGLTITNSWDPLGRLTNVAFPDGTSLRYRYDRLDLVETVDRLDHTNTYGYNSVRQKVWEKDAEGRSTGYFYCDCGGLDYTTNALGQTTRYYYDLLGRLQWTQHPDGSWSTNTYDAVGQLVCVSDAQGSTTNYYNMQGLLTVVSNAYGQVQKWLYDEGGLATNIVDSQGIAITQTYDPLGRLRTRTHPGMGTEHFGYSSRGMVAYTNFLGKVTRYGSDAAGRRTSETNANNEVTTFTYNAAGDLRTLTDGRSQTTTWIYDTYGRVTWKLDGQENGIVSYAYDPDGRMTNRYTVAKGNTYYSYDAVGNLTNVNYANSPDISLSYDDLNRLENMVDALGTSSYSYTSLGQVLTADGPWTGDTVTYSYTNRLRKGLSLEQAGASAWEQTYAYDAGRRLTNTISPAGAFKFAYTGVGSTAWPASLVQKVSLPTGGYITNVYDQAGRWDSTALMSAQNSKISGTRAGHSGYLKTAEYRDENLPDSAWINYDYDNIGQLRRAYDDAEDRRHEQFGYGYDAAHNLRYWTNYTLVKTFNVDIHNQLTNVSGSGALTVAGFTTAAATNVTVSDLDADVFSDFTYCRTNVSWEDGYNSYRVIARAASGRNATNTLSLELKASITLIYDLNGNLVSDGYRAFAYDDENQLVQVLVTNSWKSDFVYDGKMRRRIRREYDWQAGAWVQTDEVRYVYDGNLVLQERDGQDIPVATYTRGNDLSGTLQGAGGIGGLLAMTYPKPGTPPHYYYRADLNGNIVTMIDTNELVVAKYLYEPFGKVIAMNGAMATANKYRFSSKEAHVPSGLVYYLYRYYEPGLQRWLNRDPVEAHNLHDFCANDPVNRADIDGAKWVSTSKPIATKEATIVCKGGKPAVAFGFTSDIDAFEKTLKDEGKLGTLAMIDCLKKHEQEHIKDVLKQNPDLCAKAKDNTQIENDDILELSKSELNAYDVSIKCLEEAAKKYPSSSCPAQLKKSKDVLAKWKAIYDYYSKTK